MEQPAEPGDYAAMVDPKGHEARTPGEIPRRGWQDIVARTYKRTWDDNVGLVAAGVAFYSFFALLSLLGLIALTYGLIAEPSTVVAHVRRLTAVLPTDVALIIGQQLMTAVKSSEGTKGFGILFAAVVALYGGTNGAAAILTAMNIAYEEKEKRSLVRFYLMAVGMTIASLLAALFAVAGTAGIALLQAALPKTSDAGLLIGKIIGYLVLGLVAAAAAASLYRLGPSREAARWKWITPGSLFAATSWVLITAIFGWYVANLTDYSASYGSLGATVGLLTWLYLSAYVFMIGAELNSEIEHQTSKDSTTGKPEPMGHRGAWAADNVAVTDKVQDRPEEARDGQKLSAAAPQVAEKD